MVPYIQIRMREDALPPGNGRLGAMIYGHTEGGIAFDTDAGEIYTVKNG